MLSFENDYSEGAHKQILKRLCETNEQQMLAYGSDRYSARAAEKIKVLCQCPSAEVYFLMDGIQVTKIVVNTLLKTYQGVIAADIDRIVAPDASAVDFTGHKVLPIKQNKGKIDIEALRVYLDNFFSQTTSYEQLVEPGMVYVSQPTECGTLYSLDELTQIVSLCHQYQLPLYLGGARLGYGLMSSQNDVSLADIARLCDVFYIGATRIGALCGEALIFTKHNLPANFNLLIKQHATLLVKSRLLGVQFDTLFATDRLYFELSKKGVQAASLLKEGLKQKNYQLCLDSPTNQVFVIIDKQKAQRLAKHVHFKTPKILDEQRVVVRFMTSWATKQEDIRKLLSLL